MTISHHPRMRPFYKNFCYHMKRLIHYRGNRGRGADVSMTWSYSKVHFSHMIGIDAHSVWTCVKTANPIHLPNNLPQVNDSKSFLVQISLPHMTNQGKQSHTCRRQMDSWYKKTIQLSQYAPSTAGTRKQGNQQTQSKPIKFITERKRIQWIYM